MSKNIVSFCDNYDKHKKKLYINSVFNKIENNLKSITLNHYNSLYHNIPDDVVNVKVSVSDELSNVSTSKDAVTINLNIPTDSYNKYYNIDDHDLPNIIANDLKEDMNRFFTYNRYKINLIMNRLSRLYPPNIKLSEDRKEMNG